MIISNCGIYKLQRHDGTSFTGRPMLAMLRSVSLDHDEGTVIFLQREVDADDMIAGFQEGQDTFDL